MEMHDQDPLQGEVRQAGTWDPLLQCLHLDKGLLEQQNTKKLYGTKNNCTHAQLGQIMDKKIQKDKNKKPTATSEEPGAKAGYCACPLHTPPPKGWVKHLSQPSGLTPGPSPTLTPCNEPAHSPQRASKGTCCLFSLSHPPDPRCSRDPNKALPEFLVWPLINFYLLRRPRTLVRHRGMWSTDSFQLPQGLSQLQSSPVLYCSYPGRLHPESVWEERLNPSPAQG